MSIRLILSLSLFFVFLSASNGQPIQPPADSPLASVSQRVGFGDIQVEYSRPAVRDRAIFGSLVPYGQVWRTGANKPSFITLSDTTWVGNQTQPLPPGQYALYTIPAPGEWIVIFSRNLKLWGSYGYTSTDDALRVPVPSDTTSSFTESMQFSFESITDHSADLQLAWARTSIRIPLRVSISSRMISWFQESIAKAEKPDWSVYFRGAKYLHTNSLQPDLSLEWISQSVILKPGYNNVWLKARILASLGRFTEAIQAGEEALRLGLLPDVAPYFPYEAAYRSDLANWKNGRY